MNDNREPVYEYLIRIYGDLSDDWWSRFEESLTDCDPDIIPYEVARCKRLWDRLCEFVASCERTGGPTIIKPLQSMKTNSILKVKLLKIDWLSGWIILSGYRMVETIE